MIGFIVLVASAFTAFAFETHPFIRCEACTTVCTVIGAKMNETAKTRSSFKAGHRLDPDNKVKMQDYETSELRAIEIMESTCNDLAGWKLRQENGLRVIRKGPTDHSNSPRFYGSRDREALDNFDAKLKHFCHSLLDEHDETLVSAIKVTRHLDSLTNLVCVKSSGICEPAVVRKSQLDEQRKWDNSERKRKEEEARQADPPKLPDSSPTPETVGTPNAAPEPGPDATQAPTAQGVGGEPTSEAVKAEL
jgi:hypothetical protein